MLWSSIRIAVSVITGGLRRADPETAGLATAAPRTPQMEPQVRQVTGHGPVASGHPPWFTIP
jgi:hypothetical protein